MRFPSLKDLGEDLIVGLSGEAACVWNVEICLRVTAADGARLLGSAGFLLSLSKISRAGGGLVEQHSTHHLFLWICL